MKLDTILNEAQDWGSHDMPPGLTPEQEKMWPTLDPIMKNKILTAMLIKMAKSATAQNIRAVNSGTDTNDARDQQHQGRLAARVPPQNHQER